MEQLALDLPQRPRYPAAKPYPVADELLDDSEALQRLLIETVRLLPVPRPKATRNVSTKKEVTSPRPP